MKSTRIHRATINSNPELIAITLVKNTQSELPLTAKLARPAEIITAVLLSKPTTRCRDDEKIENIINGNSMLYRPDTNGKPAIPALIKAE